MEGEVIQILENWRSFTDYAQQIGQTWGSDDNKRLRHLNICRVIKAVRDLFGYQDPEIRLLLGRIAKVAYDADDALDELYKIMNIRTYAIGNSSNGQASSTLSLSNNPSLFRFNLLGKIKGINEMIDDIFEDVAKFRQTWSPNHLLPPRQSEMRLTSSVVGRKNDTRRIIDMLLPADTSSSSSSVNLNPAIIPIVGFVGVGKTTVAQLVYNNEQVRLNFKQIMWVCVADDDEFDIFKILSMILECITRSKWSQPENLDALACKIHEHLGGNCFLLVLDDVRSDNVEQWEKLKILLQIHLHQTSKIIVTTSNNKVASMVGGSIPPYRLQPLSEEECWCIIKERAFSPGGAIETPKMLKIGKDAARLCRGLPVIAAYLGSYLHSRNDETSWLALRDSDLSSVYLEKILPGMMFKYHNLPLKLRPIFSYFSMFPQDQCIQRDYLIRFWMAEGFIQLSNERNKMSMEDIGNQYFHNFLESQNVEDVVIEKDESGNVKSIRLDDLTHKLVRQVAHEDCAILKVSEMENMSYEVRRLRLVCGEEVKSISIRNNLRTLVGIQGLNSKQIGQVFSNKHLRVLELRNCMVGKLPDLSELIHLRYLELSDCEDVSFGQSISSLVYLQTLVLRGCSSLTELPLDIGSLKHLRHLDLSYTGIIVLPDSSTSLQSLQGLYLSNSQLQRLATEFGALKQLRHLDVSATKIKSLPDTIKDLCELRMFKSDSCRYLEVLPSGFATLTRLKCLDLSGTRIKELHESVISGLCNLEFLKLGYCKLPQDVRKLKCLKHFIFDGDKFETPRGISHLTCLQTLQQFVARENIESEGGGIGDLERLSLLTGKIKLCKLENVRRRKDAERANLKGKRYLRCLELHWSLRSKHNSKDGTVLDGLHPHPDLEILKITNFMGSKLPQWMGVSISSHLPKLQELVLTKCNQWKQLPALGQLPNLKVLCIHGMYSVKCLGNEVYGGECSTRGTAPFPSLVELTLGYMENLEGCDAPQSTLPPFPLLEKLTVISCDKLRVLRTPFPLLKVLNLQHCQILEDLPCIKCLKSLQRFTIQDCKKLKLSPADLQHVFQTALLDIDNPIDSF